MGRMEGRPEKSSMSQLSYPAKPPSTRQSSPESPHLPGKAVQKVPIYPASQPSGRTYPAKSPVAPRVTSSAWGPETLQA